MEQKFNRVKHITETKALREIISDMRKAEMWLMVAAIAAFLASAFFVVKYFVGGDMHPENWTGDQWLNAALGLLITAVVTAAQATLYASGYKGHGAVIATIIVVFFGLFTEISQSMEREDATVRHRSETSPVFQAALASVSRMSTPQAIVSPYAGQLADAEARLAECKAKMADGAYKNCDKSQGRVDSLRTQNAAALQAGTQAASTALPAAIAQAKQLEYDEDKHYAMIRFIKYVLGVTGIWASFLFSVIIIGTFEYCFHFVGAYVADHRTALRSMGRDSSGELLEPMGVPASVPVGTVKTVLHMPETVPEQSKSEPDTVISGVNLDGKLPEGFTETVGYRKLYQVFRTKVLNGETDSTIRPVMLLIGEFIEANPELFGGRRLGKAQKQELANIMFTTLAAEAGIGGVRLESIPDARQGQRKYRVVN